MLDTAATLCTAQVLIPAANKNPTHPPPPTASTMSALRLERLGLCILPRKSQQAVKIFCHHPGQRHPRVPRRPIQVRKVAHKVILSLRCPITTTALAADGRGRRRAGSAPARGIGISVRLVLGSAWKTTATAAAGLVYPVYSHTL